MRLRQGNTPWRETIAGSKVLTCQFYSSCSWCYCSAAAAATITTGAVNLERAVLGFDNSRIPPPLPLEKIPVNPHRLNTALSVAPLKNTLALSVQSGGARVTLYVSPQIRIVSEQRLDFFPSLASLRTSNGQLKNTP